MPSTASAMVNAAAPIVRAAARAAQSSALRAAAGSALRRTELGVPALTQRHPLTPAALRVERARSGRRGARTDLTAVTVWFGEGPRLPGSGGAALRSAVRLGGGALGAAALAAMTVIAARREEERKVIDAPGPHVRRREGEVPSR